MRSLFWQVSNRLKLRHAEIERLLAHPSSKSVLEVSLEEAFDWAEFGRLYELSDLFQWHKDGHLGSGEVLDLDEIREGWLEDERIYEKDYIEVAKIRVLQDRERRLGIAKKQSNGKK
ncbi:hypothetical protein BGX27_010171 [Mortierella sp. AM989]|nr:hypothetical protein BGX27_010171 [Mortierella sp. AM989]